MIEAVIKELCNYGAQAVARYVDVTDTAPEYMPEYFMPGFILDHWGDHRTVTLETSFAKLLEWNEDSASRAGLRQPRSVLEVLSATDKLGSPRVDLVIFKDPHLPKKQQDMLALVEFKRQWIDGAQIPGRQGDRDKLRSILDYIDTCSYGVVCGWIRAAYRDGFYADALKAGDKWFETKFQLGDGKSCFFCARLFGPDSAVNHDQDSPGLI